MKLTTSHALSHDTEESISLYNMQTCSHAAMMVDHSPSMGVQMTRGSPLA
jgi:hypothetical protein